MLWLCIRLPRLGLEPSAAHAALERLAAWAYQWSSQVSFSVPELLWLEFDASRSLFGGRAALLGRIEHGLAQLGYTYCCALAPSPTAAALLTRAPPPRHVLVPAQLRSRLDPLPLSLLELPEATRSALQSAGLVCIGQVLALPDAALARRFGPQATRYLRRLCCRADDPRPAWRLPETYSVRCEFEAAIGSLSWAHRPPRETFEVRPSSALPATWIVTVASCA